MLLERGDAALCRSRYHRAPAIVLSIPGGRFAGLALTARNGLKAASKETGSRFAEMAGIEHKQVDGDEAGMRLDRWFKVHYPRTGLRPAAEAPALRPDPRRRRPRQIRHAPASQARSVRIPPLDVDAKEIKTGPIAGRDLRHSPRSANCCRAWCCTRTPRSSCSTSRPGIAVQGGSGVNRHIDKMLEAWTNQKGEKPRLVHRLDRDTSGVLVDRPHPWRRAEADRCLPRARHQEDLLGTGEGRTAQARRPHLHLARQGTDAGRRPHAHRQARRGRRRPRHFLLPHSSSRPAQNLAWLEMEPYTGRTHQLRVHAAAHRPSDPRRSQIFRRRCRAGALPGGMQNRLHLHARHIDIPHPDGGRLRVTAPHAAAHGPELEPARLRHENERRARMQTDETGAFRLRRHAGR